MQRDKHNLVDDFPEYADKIQSLKEGNEEFRIQCKRYHELEHLVRGLEMQGVPASDDRFENLKKERLLLKDQIFAQLQQ